jgi:hypothetical protein
MARNRRGVHINWHGKYLNEEEIAADMIAKIRANIAKIRANPEGVKVWLDPISWELPRSNYEELPPHAGALMNVGMQVRNYYGLWHPECPYTKTSGDDLEVKDGIITDPRFPDNLSARIIERVRKVFADEAKQSKELHIADSHPDRLGFSWCGEPLVTGSAIAIEDKRSFRTVEEAAQIGRRGDKDSFIVCTRCLERVTAALRHGHN